MSDIVERLRTKVQVYPTQGGCSVGVNPLATSSYVTDDGKRLRNPDGPEAAATIEALQARVEVLVGALAKVMPLTVENGPDYAEVYFGDGGKHSTQAMTMGPQDWLDLQVAYQALTKQESSDAS